ncbi:MAG TPA: hypothetical protein VEZ90_01685, partial [Blastocatellia bacterium]|nr:hypothetical protein [Blastocatellia bacterium]
MTVISRCCYDPSVAENVKQAIPVIVGPTASGKSDLGIELALRIRPVASRERGSIMAEGVAPRMPGESADGTECFGEIVNLDSVQVYRRLYIATAKVPLEERRGVPHHLVDIVEPTENFTAGEYARRASEVIAEIEGRGHIPILVGGTGFYLRALV